MRTIDWIALILVILGGLNWGVIAITGQYVFGAAPGALSPTARIIYGVIGLAALFMIGVAFTKLNQCSYHLLHSHSTTKV